MAFAAGVFSLIAGNPVVTGTTISSTWANNTLSDIASGLSTCVLKDGTQATTAVVPFASGISLGGGTSLTTYAESTWTPVLKFGATTSGTTYGGQSGRLTRTGRELFAEFSITLTSRGSSTGTATITGLSNASVFNSVGNIEWSAMTSTMLFMAVELPGTATMSVKGLTAAATSLANLAMSDFAELTIINGSIRYTV